MLGAGNILLGGLAIPLYRLGVVLREALSVLVHEAKFDLGFGIPLLCGQAIPLRSFVVVLRDAFTNPVHATNYELEKSIALLGEWTPFLQSRLIVAPLIGCQAFIEASRRQCQSKIA